MALNVKIGLYRGPLSDLTTLATTGQAGVLAWTTDTNELYVDAGSGSAGIGAGNAWQKVAQDLVAVNAQTGTTYTIASTDRSKLVTFNNSSAVAVTLPVATGAGFPAGFIFKVYNKGAGTVTITPATSTINGGATLTLLTGQGCDIISDASNYYATVGVTTFPVTSPVTNEFVTGINASGVASLAQPSFSNLSGSATAGQVPNIQSLNGTLTEGQLPATIGSGSNLTLVDCGTF